MLECSLSKDNEQLKQAYAAMEENRANPEFLRYLVYCVAHGSSLHPSVRAVAGATAKSMVDSSFTDFPPEIKAYVKSEMVRILIDPHDSVRRIASNVVSTIVRDDELSNWRELPAILNSLLDMVDNPIALDGCLTALEQMSDDVPQMFDDAEVGHPLNLLLPKVIVAMGHPDTALRYKATKTAANFLHTDAPAISLNRHQLLTAFGTLTADPAPKIREAVSFALSTFLETDTVGVWPAINEILAFQMRCLADPHREVAIAGADFWSIFCEAMANYEEGQPAIYHVIDPLMPELVRTLISRMVLTDDDLEGRSTADVADAGVADRDADIAPDAGGRSGTAARHGGAATGSDHGVRSPGAAAGAGAAGGDDEEEEEEEEDTGRNPNEGAAFTVRKGAGGALEVLGLVYREHMLPHAVAEIAARLSIEGDTEAAWRAREAALLAIGCLAFGCSEQMAGHMAHLYPYLVSVTTGRRPIVRGSAVWALSKFSAWMVEMQAMSCEEREEALARGDVAAAAAQEFVQPMVDVLVARLADHNKSVQQAALLATVDFITTCAEQVAPYVPQLLGCLLANYPRYQLKNRLYLYDCVGALAESAPEEFGTPAHLAIVVPGLLGRLDTLPNGAYETSVLVGCISAVVSAGGPLVLDYLPRIFTRAVALLESELIMEAAAADLGADAVGRSGAAGDTLRISNCVDLIDAVVDVAGAGIADTLAATSVLDGLQYLLPHPSARVRTSSLCLLGTMAIHTPAVLEPGLAVLGKHIAPSIRYTKDNTQACNNALWALGQLVKRFGRGTAPFIPRCLPRLVDVLNEHDKPRTIYENAAITLGLIGSAYTDVVAPNLGSILHKWCLAIIRVTSPAERIDAYTGLCTLLAANPAAGPPHLEALIKALVSYRDAAPEMRAMIKAAFDGVRALASPEQLSALAAKLTSDERATAAALFV